MPKKKKKNEMVREVVVQNDSAPQRGAVASAGEPGDDMPLQLTIETTTVKEEGLHMSNMLERVADLRHRWDGGRGCGCGGRPATSDYDSDDVPTRIALASVQVLVHRRSTAVPPAAAAAAGASGHDVRGATVGVRQDQHRLERARAVRGRIEMVRQPVPASAQRKQGQASSSDGAVDREGDVAERLNNRK